MLSQYYFQSIHDDKYSQNYFQSILDNKYFIMIVLVLLFALLSRPYTFMTHNHNRELIALFSSF